MRSWTSEGQQRIKGDQVLENPSFHLWKRRQAAHGDIHRILRSDAVRGVIWTHKDIRLRERVKVVRRDGFDLERGSNSGVSRLDWHGDSSRDSDF
jgi:hypothetical protein